MKRPNSFIGSPVERLEDFRFLRGRGEYVDDLARDTLLHAVILRSTVAHGRLLSIDAQAALALPGVRAVLTAADIGEVPLIPQRLQLSPGIERYWQPVLATDKVRYVGEPVAVVLADTPAIGEDALETIALKIEELPVVHNWRSSAKNQTLLFEKTTDSNCPKEFTGIRGDADWAYTNAPYRRRESFRSQRHTALPMEPRGLLAEWDAGIGRLRVFGAAKVPYFNRSVLSKLIGLPEDVIDLIENDVGGGFGARGEFYPEDFLIPFAAKWSGRPVKWIEDRRDHLLAINHARDMEADLEIACASDGTVLGIRGRIYVDTGAYLRSNGLTPPRNVAQFLSGPYRIPHISVAVSVQMTNKTPCGTYRAPGRFEGSYFCERLFDMAARDLGIDQVEFRRRNLVPEAEIPYPFATITPEDAYSSSETDSGDYKATLERCLADFKWNEKLPLAGRLIDGRYHGISVGCFVEGGAAGPSENARLVVETDGSVSVYIGSAALGQGLETICTQIAADALELPLSSIRGIFHGSTHCVRMGYGSFHSRAVVMGGSALLLAAERLKQAACAAAARRLGCAPEKVRFAEGGVLGPGGRTLALAELSSDGLEVEETFASPKNTYAYGAAAAHVAVDPKTGHVAVVDFTVVEDVGRIMNPSTLHGQVIGALVQGLGSSLLEELVYNEEGQLLTGTLADYMTPTASDFPSLKAVSVELRPCPNNPLGAKGAGEGGIISVGGVISNAVASALASFGAQPREMPLSPQRVWQLIQDATRKFPS
jgi:carbon-monoxide dehydrogenase large subunit